MNKIDHAHLYRLSFFVLLLLSSGGAAAAIARVDSVGVKYENGKKVIIHELVAKETYFGLSRHYNIPVKQLIAANGNKALKVGDTVHIPMASHQLAATNGATDGNGTTQQDEPPVLAPDEYTSYKVGKGETLSTVSKRFIISVESIKRANGLTDEALKIGQILKVPHKELPPPPPKASEIRVVDTAGEVIEKIEIPANRYGIREMTEKGIGVWIDDLNQEGGNMLALHKTAPIGSVIKITNPMTNRTTFAKVVGQFADTAETKNAIIVISKSAASLIGVLDRRFQVEIAYGAPHDGN